MASNQIPVLIISEIEHTRLAELAHQRGYPAPEDYLRALIAADAQQHGNPPPLEGDDVPSKFKRAFREALHGDFLTEDEFWDEVNDAD